MIPLKQSTASQEIPLGYFVDSTDGNTEETGLTINNTDIKLWKAGATTLANKNSGGATHISNGIYYCTLDDTDTNTPGPLVVFVHVAGSLAIRVPCVVYPANVYDSLIAGSDKLQVHADEITAGLITAAAIADNAIDAAAIAADAVTEIQSGLATAAALAIIDDFLDTEIAAIKASTDNLPSDPADQSALAALIDAVDNFVDTEVAAIKAVTDKLDTALELDGAVYRYTTNALEQGPGGGGSDPWATELPGSYNPGEAGYILGTNLDQKISLINQSPGTGAITFTYTLSEQGTGNPITGADVWVTTDSAGTNVVASGTTNLSGIVTFYLDAGPHYFWRQKSGWNFTNPDTEVVS